MSDLGIRVREERSLADVLVSFDEGTRALEDAYRELWVRTERERAERALAESERVRDLCHEIGNPLGGVRGLADLLRRELETQPAARRLLDQMIAGLDAADAVVRRASVAEEERCDAGAVAEETVGLALAETAAAGKDLRFRVDSPEGIELPIAPSRFREVVASLVRNAVEACGPDGTVAVSVGSESGAVVLAVEDDGHGLPRIPDAALFRRGFSTKGIRRGRGLARVEEVVAEAGGTLVFCRLERGTLVRARLPR